MSYLWDFNISLIGEMLAQFMDLLRSILNDEDSTVTKLIQKKQPTLPSASISNKHECVQPQTHEKH